MVNAGCESNSFIPYTYIRISFISMPVLLLRLWDLLTRWYANIHLTHCIEIIKWTLFLSCRPNHTIHSDCHCSDFNFDNQSEIPVEECLIDTWTVITQLSVIGTQSIRIICVFLFSKKINVRYYFRSRVSTGVINSGTPWLDAHRIKNNCVQK